jgi:hypothetical protein
MATRERDSPGPSFGIAHGTVVPENAEPDRLADDAERPDEEDGADD